MNDKKPEVGGWLGDVRLVALSLAFISVFGFMSYALYLASVGSVAAGIVLAFLIAGIFAVSIALVVSWANNRDNAMIASIAKPDQDEMYKNMRNRAMAEAATANANTATLRTSQQINKLDSQRPATPVPPAQFTYDEAVIDME